MNQEKLEELFDRYLKRMTSLEEDRLIERWLQDHENSYSKWNEMDKERKNKWLSHTFVQISHTIDAPSAIKSRSLTKRRLAFTAAITAAASIIFALILNSEIPSIKHFWKSEEYTVQVTNKGQRKLIVLADGSRVWVNQNSTLKYPKEFDGNTREVYLSGEAYFDVRHNAKKTFIIHNGNFSTTVLGTAFNIREDKGKHTIEVTVTRGKVSVANAGKALAFITPNQQVSFNIPKQQLQKATVDADQASSWKLTDLHFEDVTFGEAIEQLSVHFGVNILFSNEKLKNCRFSGTNLAHQNLEDILKVMCAFNNASYQKNKDCSIMISGKGCN